LKTLRDPEIILPKLSIIICVYNEAASALPVIEKVRAVQLSDGWSKEIIVVDNCSTDGTREQLRGLNQPDVRVMYHEHNLGKGASVRTGFGAASGDYGVIQDADFEYDPNDLALFTARAGETGATAVFGSRTLGGRHIYKYVQNYWGVRFLTALTNLLFGGRLSDVAVATKMVRVDVFRALNLRSSAFDLDFELPCALLKHQHAIAEVPVSYTPRTIEEGKKIRWTDGLHAMWVILKMRLRG
jgi:glycosyltransferase involved in cell wall biosynthesis